MSAIVLTSTVGMSYDRWLEWRRKGIGGSDASVVCGVNSYKSPVELFMQAFFSGTDNADENGLYFKLTEPLRPFNAFLFRTIKHMKDYTGGHNQWLPCSLFATGDYERLIGILWELRESVGTTEVERRAA